MFLPNNDCVEYELLSDVCLGDSCISLVSSQFTVLHPMSSLTNLFNLLVFILIPRDTNQVRLHHVFLIKINHYAKAQSSRYLWTFL